MEERNKEIRDNLERIMAIRGIANGNQLSEKLKGKVTQPAIYMLLNRPEENNPTTKTLRALSDILNIQPWMLLIKNFPFKSIQGKPLEEISEQGYTLLHAYENAPTEAKIAILDQAEFLIRKYDKASPEANRVAETRSEYNPK